MKIAQVSPIFESVPPKRYGGTERVIAYLTDALVRLGHEVTLFASGDSSTLARLVSATPVSIRPSPKDWSWMAWHAIQMDLVAQAAHEFDVIHFHTDYQHFPLAKQLHIPHLTTMHGRQDLSWLAPLYAHFSGMPLVSISNSQRAPMPQANWIGTVYHGLPPDLYSGNEAPGEYLLFVGRISPEKRIDRAVEIAQRCGMQLRVAAKIDEMDEAYFNDKIRPLFDLPFVEYVGEVGEQQKRVLLEGATALLFPIDWPEPFGLVMIEALASGTPVIAWRNGAIPEIVEHGVTGFIVDNVDEAVDAARRIDKIDRRACRAAFERRFTASAMANGYLRLYDKVLSDPSQSS
jgi:glycosyltransferase involved in cell wall biosynthesis